MNEGGWILVLLVGFSAFSMIVSTICDSHKNAEIQALKVACAVYQAEIKLLKEASR